MAPGSTSMLRSRRKDVNVKPNRRLDKKSSRGMLYENEELRMRTITINEEVERGQSDIKKLRRENEQLRREIWGLRDEYDRLEGIIEDLKDATDSEEGQSDDEDEEEPEPEVAENPENLENAEKEQKAANAQPLENNRGTPFKKEFDGLSVVDEETDDNPSNSMHEISPDPTTLSAGVPIGWQYGSPASQPWPHPAFFGPASGDFPANAAVYEGGGFCGTITLPSGRQGVYFSAATPPPWEEAEMRAPPKMGYAYSYTGPPAPITPLVADQRCGPDLLLPTLFPAEPPPLEDINHNMARIQIIPQQPADQLADQPHQQSPPPASRWQDFQLSEQRRPPEATNDYSAQSQYGATAAPRWQDFQLAEQREPEAADGCSAQAQNGRITTPFWPNLQLAEQSGPLEATNGCSVQSQYGATPAALRWSDLQLAEQRAPETQGCSAQLQYGATPAALRWSDLQLAEQRAPETQGCSAQLQYGATPAARWSDLQLQNEISILKRRQSIISTTISVSRQDEEVYGQQQCEAYRKLPPYIRLNSIRPNTLVFASDYEDLTVQEVIDALDAQISTSLSDAVRGVRVVNGSCFICLAKQEDVGSLLSSGFCLRDCPVVLEDVSKGSVIVSLSGVPHHVTDSAVAIIMSNFGTIIGEVERRLYKGVDTGERLVRLKPGRAVSQQLPPSISVAGAQVGVAVLPPQEVDRLGFVGTRDNPANEMTCHSFNHTDPGERVTSKNSDGSDTPTQESFNSDRFKSQLLVHLKTPDHPPDRPPTPAVATASVGVNLSKVVNGVAAPKKYSTARCPQNVSSAVAPPPLTGFVPPDGGLSCNPFAPPVLQAPPLYADHHPQAPLTSSQAQNNPFIPGFVPLANEHVNPTFNTYTPKTSPTTDRKFSGTTNKTFVEAQSQPPTPVGSKVAASPSGTVPGSTPLGAPVPNSSYLHGRISGPANEAPRRSSHSVASDREQLDVPTPAVSVPSSPMAARKQRPTRVSRQRSADEQQPTSPLTHRKTRGPRKLSGHSTSSQNLDNSENERSLPTATSSPVARLKHGSRRPSVSVQPAAASGLVDVSRSSSSGQDSPTKGDRRRRVSVYFGNKKPSTRRGSAATPGALTRSASLDPTRCRFAHAPGDGGLTEPTTTCSERERTNSCSSRGSSLGPSGKRRSTAKGFDGSDSGKVPWCGCWGNGCV